MKHTFNLLPQSSQRRAEHRSQRRCWLAIWSVAMSALVVAQIMLLRARDQTQQLLVAREQTTAPIRRLQTELQQLQSSIETMRRRIELDQTLEQADVPLALLQVIADCCRRLPSELQLEMLRVNEGPAARPTPEGHPPQTSKQVLLVGSAAGDAQVTALVSDLRKCEVFATVELESSQAVSDNYPSRRTFQIRCLH